MAEENTQKLTPLMQQYWDIKNQHLDKILLFRMGDFYEMFHEDAIRAAPILNIALTSRSKSQGVDVPMCGVPHASIGGHIHKFLKAGIKVAICDQLESPLTMEGKIVKRGVTRVVTPGLVYDPEQLDSKSSHYVCAVIVKSRGLYDFSAVDASTGEVLVSKNISPGQVISWTSKLQPREFLIQKGMELFFDPQCVITDLASPTDSVEDFLVQYVRDTQGEEILQTLQPSRFLEEKCLSIAPTSIKHLEIFKTYDHQEQGTLFASVNMTQTPMGARLLKTRLSSPFLELNDILTEQSKVENFVIHYDLAQKISKALHEIGDLERKVVKLSNPLCNARDVQSLGRALASLCDLMDLAPEFFKELLPQTAVQQWSDKIKNTLRDELPHSVREGGIIRAGVSSILDEYVDLATHAQTKLSELESRERAQSGIQSLKIKYNNIFGYSFEITKANLDKVPSHFVRRQTLAQAERFITPELSELEQKILSSEQKRGELEFEIYNDLRKSLLTHALSFLKLSKAVAHIDLIQSWARLARQWNYCKPTFNSEGRTDLKKSRHCVIEQNPHQVFIPNDIEISKGQCILLTGPNMAGKSTVMRQVALTSILAQCGSYVPAEFADLPIFDKIFTRIGSSDNLSQGLSTFMVEMTETAQIIKEATGFSLIILDEIGRGTSTYDGLSLAQAVLEHFVEEIQATVFFATHYHELTELGNMNPLVRNFHMSIEEHKNELVFLRKLKAGPANRSYGIEVAKLAGLPLSVTAKATKILKELVKKSEKIHSRQLNMLESEVSPTEDVELWKTMAQKYSKALEEVDINNMTPLMAFQFLTHLKEIH